MAYKQHDEGKKRPRGRPFAKGNKKGKIENEILDDSGREIGVEGGVIASDPRSAIVEPVKQEIKPLADETNTNNENLNKILKETMNSNQDEEALPAPDEKKDLELIDCLEFKNGENTLTIRFSKKHNRMFRIQVFLNDHSEIRPVTYTGASTGYAFWNLLKGAMKK